MNGLGESQGGDHGAALELKAVAQRLGVSFGDFSNLRAAFVHESYVHEFPDEESNERLEFLGDAVLGLATSEMLYERFPAMAEGELTRIKAMIVSRVSLASQARDLNLGAALLLSRGGEASGERERNSLLADVFEAVVGAMFLDCGWEVVREFVRCRFLHSLDGLTQTDRNFKSLLQHQTQKYFKALPVYRVVREKGPAHSKLFSVEVHFRGEILGRGSGRSKKEAQQEAAREALAGMAALIERLTAVQNGEGSAAPEPPSRSARPRRTATAKTESSGRKSGARAAAKRATPARTEPPARRGASARAESGGKRAAPGRAAASKKKARGESVAPPPRRPSTRGDATNPERRKRPPDGGR